MTVNFSVEAIVVTVLAFAAIWVSLRAGRRPARRAADLKAQRRAAQSELEVYGAGGVGRVL